MQFVYVLIEYFGNSGMYEVRGTASSEAKAIAWKLSSPERTYDKWRVK